MNHLARWPIRTNPNTQAAPIVGVRIKYVLNVNISVSEQHGTRTRNLQRSASLPLAVPVPAGQLHRDSHRNTPHAESPVTPAGSGQAHSLHSFVRTTAGSNALTAFAYAQRLTHHKTPAALPLQTQSLRSIDQCRTLPGGIMVCTGSRLVIFRVRLNDQISRGNRRASQVN